MAKRRTSSSHGQPFSSAHFITSRPPSPDAHRQVHSSHGQPFSRAHLRTSRWPPAAASEKVRASHGQPFSRAHLRTSKLPPPAASRQKFWRTLSFSCEFESRVLSELIVWLKKRSHSSVVNLLMSISDIFNFDFMDGTRDPFLFYFFASSDG